jgi:hypothetical protein
MSKICQSCCTWQKDQTVYISVVFLLFEVSNFGKLCNKRKSPRQHGIGHGIGWKPCW